MVPKSAFVPNPEIDSIVLRIKKKSSIPFVSSEELLSYWEFVSSCFGQKRKTIYNNLKTFRLERTTIESILRGISKNARPEQLTNDEFVSIWRRWKVEKTSLDGGNI